MAHPLIHRLRHALTARRRRVWPRRVHAALLRPGGSLTALSTELDFAIAARPPELSLLRACAAVLAIELADLDRARRELVALPKNTGLVRALFARIAFVEGEIAEIPWGGLDDPPELSDLSVLLREDVTAQRALASRQPMLAPLPLLPVTRLRALAAAGREDEARALLGRLAGDRMSAMCRLHPRDPATRLAHGHAPAPQGPYR